MGNEVGDEALGRAFQKYPSFLKAKVVRDRRTGKSKGYGFVSFKNSDDFIKAMREMDGNFMIDYFNQILEYNVKYNILKR